jgi:hypothetical protein
VCAGQARQGEPRRAAPRRAARKKVFESEFREWISAQNARVDSQGIPGAELRPW